MGNGGLTDQIARRKRSDGTATGGDGISGTSIFDPVLTELLVRWYSAEGHTILDPFAGGSVRGIVSAMLGRDYIGYDLRLEQIEANREQANAILKDATGTVHWEAGDSREMIGSNHVAADLIMTCPPYADLEVYSDDPRDISTMRFPAFMQAFEEIMRRAVECLRNDRFVAIVIGDARDKRNASAYYGLPAHTTIMMQRLGLRFHNELILRTPVGSLPGRVKQHFVKSRKVGRGHQSVLVFVKGDAVKATGACGECEFGDGDPFIEEQPDIEPPTNPLEGLGEVL